MDNETTVPVTATEPGVSSQDYFVNRMEHHVAGLRRELPADRGLRAPGNRRRAGRLRASATKTAKVAIPG